MKNQNETDNAMHETLAGLRGPIEPGRDLWPDIASRLGEQEAPQVDRERDSMRTRPWMALAASVAVAFVVGVLFGRSGESPMPDALPSVVASGVSWVMPTYAAALQGTELEYQSAFKGFQPITDAPSVLEGQAEQDIKASWQDLQQAEAALTAAIELHPENIYLAEKLLDLRSQQLEFMRQLQLLNQNSRREI